MKAGAELSAEDVTRQAESYLEYEARGGRGLEFWIGPRGYTPADERAVRGEVRRLRVVRALGRCRQ
jgi:hypothetical protein